MTIKCDYNWHCRKGGGIFLGIRIHAPCSINYGDGDSYDHNCKNITATIGFIFFSVNIQFNYAHKKIE
jgi:hypothetical protein